MMIDLIDDRDQRWLKGLICKTCQYCPAVQSSNPSWAAISDILQSKGATEPHQEELNGWKVAVTEHERWLQSVLNNIVYYLNEPPDYQQNQSDYALPDSEDTVSTDVEKSLPGFNLLTLSRCCCAGWREHQSASALSSVKVGQYRGLEVFRATLWTSLTQSSSGSLTGGEVWLQLLSTISSTFIPGKTLTFTSQQFYSINPFSNLGFSSPISNGMFSLLQNYLAIHTEKRDSFWLCSDSGQLGDKTNIWFLQK